MGSQEDNTLQRSFIVPTYDQGHRRQQGCREPVWQRKPKSDDLSGSDHGIDHRFKAPRCPNSQRDGGGHSTSILADGHVGTYADVQGIDVMTCPLRTGTLLRTNKGIGPYFGESSSDFSPTPFCSSSQREGRALQKKTSGRDNIDVNETSMGPEPRSEHTPQRSRSVAGTARSQTGARPLRNRATEGTSQLMDSDGKVFRAEPHHNKNNRPRQPPRKKPRRTAFRESKDYNSSPDRTINYITPEDLYSRLEHTVNLLRSRTFFKHSSAFVPPEACTTPVAPAQEGFQLYNVDYGAPDDSRALHSPCGGSRKVNNECETQREGDGVDASTTNNIGRASSVEPRPPSPALCNRPDDASRAESTQDVSQTNVYGKVSSIQSDPSTSTLTCPRLTLPDTQPREDVTSHVATCETPMPKRGDSPDNLNGSPSSQEAQRRPASPNVVTLAPKEPSQASGTDTHPATIFAPGRKATNRMPPDHQIFEISSDKAVQVSIAQPNKRLIVCTLISGVLAIAFVAVVLFAVLSH